MSCYIRLEKRKENTVVYLGRDGSRTLSVCKGATIQQVRDAIGYLPSGTPNRYKIAAERIAAARLQDDF